MTEAGPSSGIGGVSGQAGGTAGGTAGGGEGSTTEEALLKVPQKRFYRQRAHANVFVDHLLD